MANGLMVIKFMAGSDESFPDMSLVITKTGLYFVDESTGTHYWDK